MEQRAFNHLYSENKRLSELVVQITAESNYNRSHHLHPLHPHTLHHSQHHQSHEVDQLYSQLNALREECVSLRQENELLKSKDEVLPLPSPSPSSPPSLPLQQQQQYNNTQPPQQQTSELKKAREQMLLKLQDMHIALDGLSSQGSHLHKMVTAMYHTKAHNQSHSQLNQLSNNTEQLTHPEANLNSLSAPSTTNPTPIITTPVINSPPSITSTESPINDGGIDGDMLADSQQEDIVPQLVLRDTGETMKALSLLEQLLSPLWGGSEFDIKLLGLSVKNAEDELAYLEEVFEATYKHTEEKEPKLPTITSYIAPLANNSIPPPPPPPPPILVTPPPTLKLPTLRKVRKDEDTEDEEKEERAVAQKEEKKEEKSQATSALGFLQAIQAIKPDSEARLQKMEEFVKERVEKKESDLEEGDKVTPVSHMDRLMRALKKVKVDSSVRMAAITQVEQAVQTRSKTVISDRLITDTMIVQQRVQLKKASGGIAALEEARNKKLEALRAQYREEARSLSHTHSFVSSDGGGQMYQYESYDDEDEEEDDDFEGGLMSIVQGMIKPSPRSTDTGNNSEAESVTSHDDEDYYSDEYDEDEDSNLFESLGLIVHERFAASGNLLQDKR